MNLFLVMLFYGMFISSILLVVCDLVMVFKFKRPFKDYCFTTVFSLWLILALWPIIWGINE